jgi:hypothetical protein
MATTFSQASIETDAVVDRVGSCSPTRHARVLIALTGNIPARPGLVNQVPDWRCGSDAG